MLYILQIIFLETKHVYQNKLNTCEVKVFECRCLSALGNTSRQTFHGFSLFLMEYKNFVQLELCILFINIEQKGSSSKNHAVL